MKRRKFEGKVIPIASILYVEVVSFIDYEDEETPIEDSKCLP